MQRLTLLAPFVLLAVSASTSFAAGENNTIYTPQTREHAPGDARKKLATQPHIVREFKNPDCQKTQSCDLKSFKMEVWKTYSDSDQHDTEFDDLYQGDLMVAGFETKDLASLEKFGVVQWIKGCNIGMTTVNGKTDVYINSQRDYFDFKQYFIHPDWVVDSIDSDPMYASVPYDPSRYGSIPEAQWKRHAAHRIYKPNPFVDETPEMQAVYQFKAPPESKLYISDYPTGSYGSSDRSSTNHSFASMQFRTCIFKTADIPKKVKPEWTGDGKELVCFEWSNNHRYDPVKDIFVDAKAIDPRCEDKKWADDLYVQLQTPAGEATLDWTKKSCDYGIPAQSCDALYGAKTSSGAHFAGDLCIDFLNSGRDTSKFLTPIGKDGRVVPNPVLVDQLVPGSGSSVRLSTLRQQSVSEITEMFRDLKARAVKSVTAESTGSEVDSVVLDRLSKIELGFLEAGPGCEGGAELSADYNAIINTVLLCPGWTNMPRESVLQIIAVQIARALDVCGIKPIYTMSSAFVTDLKKAKPVKVGACFKNHPDLKAPQVIAFVNEQMMAVVDSGMTEFETLQPLVDAQLVKCGLVKLSSRVVPKDFSRSVTTELWTCGRKASGDATSSSAVSEPWNDKKACSERVREITRASLTADLMSSYLKDHSGFTSSEGAVHLLYSSVSRSCSQQTFTSDDIVGSFERLGLFLGKPEIRAAIGCTDTSAPMVCETRLFSK